MIEIGSRGTIDSMKFRLAFASLCVALLSPSLGCNTTQNCTLQAVPSVQLTVVDADTGEDIDATVSFRLDGDGPRMPEFERPGRYTLASEVEGVFDVTIEADGYDTVMRVYEVMQEEEGCHVETEEDTIMLSPTM